MGPIGPEQLELFGIELWKIAALDFVYSLTCTNKNHSAPYLVTMNYEHKISGEFDYGSSHTGSVGVLCPWNRKIELQLSNWYLSSLLTYTA